MSEQLILSKAANIKRKLYAFFKFTLIAGALGIYFQNCSVNTLATSGSNESPSTGAMATASPVALQKKLIVGFGDSLTRGANPKNPSNTGLKGYVPLLQNQLGDEFEILNCGIGGQTTFDAKLRFFEISQGHFANCTLDISESENTAAFYDYSRYEGRSPDTIIIWLGTNNVLKNAPQFLKSYADLHAMISTATARGQKVILMTIPTYSTPNYAPLNQAIFSVDSNRVQVYNSLIHRLSEEFPTVSFVDIYQLISDQWTYYTWDGIHISTAGYDRITNLLLKAIKENFKSPVYPESNSTKNCQLGTGYKVPHGQISCSCSSGSRGEVSRCNNGIFEKIGELGKTCISFLESFALINYHCPIKRVDGNTISCEHPVTKAQFPQSLCMDQ